MCYGQLAELWEKSDEHIPLMDQMEKVMQNDSRAMESLGNRLNWDFLTEEAKRNQEKPSEGIAKASVATGLGFLGAGIGNWLQGGQGGVNVGSGMSAAPGPGVVANGMQGAAITDSMLINAGYPQMAGYLMSGGGGAGTQNAMRLMGMMNQQPQQPPPPQPMPRQQGQFEPLPMMGEQSFGMPEMPKDPRFMTEEEKRRLMMRQRGGFY